ncbi:ComEC/Rec2 family competence protein [Candidatus Nomurabacteria bacterium]|nr:ComEC/Rec2 family competence protein [Candidatus Nomurabacteria bacterium]
MRLNDGGILFYSAIIAFALGIFARSFARFSLSEIALLVLLAVVVGLVGQGARVQGSRPLPGLLLISLTIMSFALGALRMDFAILNSTESKLEEMLGSEVVLEGVIWREPEARANSIHLYIKTDYGLILALAYPGEEWNYGDRVLVEGVLEKPEAFETDLGRTFNYPGYLLAKGVGYTIRRAEVERLSEGGAYDFISKILDLKHTFMQKLELLMPEPQVGLSEGLLLGVKRALGEDLETTFRKTGIIHIVVLSGYNVMIVVTFILYVLGQVFGRRFSVGFGLVGIVIFALMVGLSATVVRACLMASLLLIVGLTGRIYLVLRGLMLAGFIMLIWNPYSLAFDVGFQLSFIATLGLILVAPDLQERLRTMPSPLGAREFLVATLATQLFVLPLLLYQIGEFSVVAVIVNVLVLPMVAVSMLLTFLTGMVAFVSLSLATPLAFVTHLSLTYIIVIAEWFGELPFASFTVPAFSFWFVPLGYALIALVLWWSVREVDELKGWTIKEI